MCEGVIKSKIRPQKLEGYYLCVDDDFKAVGVENTTDVHVEFIKLVDGLCWTHIPHNPIIQHKVIGWIEGGTVPLVVVG